MTTISPWSISHTKTSNLLIDRLLIKVIIEGTYRKTCNKKNSDYLARSRERPYLADLEHSASVAHHGEIVTNTISKTKAKYSCEELLSWMS